MIIIQAPQRQAAKNLSILVKIFLFDDGVGRCCREFTGAELLYCERNFCWDNGVCLAWHKITRGGSLSDLSLMLYVSHVDLVWRRDVLRQFPCTY